MLAGLAPILLANGLLATSAAMQVSAVPVISVYELTPKDLREQREREARLKRLCQSAVHNRNTLAHLKADAQTLSDVADRLWYGNGGCRKNPELAIAVLRFAIDDKALGFPHPDMVAQLTLYLKAQGDPVDRAELLDLSGILWTRGDYYNNYTPQPQWTPEEKRAFVARDDIWAFLSAADTRKSWQAQEARLEALLDPLSPRYAPLEAVAFMEAGNLSQQWVRAAKILLEGKQFPLNAPRAQALLMKAAPYDDEARLLLGPVLAAQLANPDAAIRNASIQQFEPWAHKEGPGATAIRSALLSQYQMMLAASQHEDQYTAVDALTRYALAYKENDPAAVLRWIDATLRADNEADKRTARRNFGHLANARIAGTEHILVDAYHRSGGLVDAGALSSINLKPLIMDNDYPSRAMRQKQDGVVESEAIIGPDGRALVVTITKTPWPVLGEIVQRTVMRRLRIQEPLPYPGRYMRVTLPPVQFRLASCDSGDERPAAIAGAWLVEGVCFRSVLDVVTPLNVATP